MISTVDIRFILSKKIAMQRGHHFLGNEGLLMSFADFHESLFSTLL